MHRGGKQLFCGTKLPKDPPSALQKSERTPPDPSLSSPQGAEGLPVAHSTEGALHVQLPSTEDPGGHADDSQLVPVCMDSRCLAEPRQEYPCVCHRHHL